MRVHHYDPTTGETTTSDVDTGLRAGVEARRVGSRQDKQTQEQAPTAGQFDPQALFDPAYKAQQQTALDAMSREVAYGGWSPEERQSYERQAAQSAGVAMGQRMGTAQQMISKGLPPSVANQIAGEVGQQQEAQAGYLFGTAAQQSANERARQAALSMSNLSGQMQQESAQETQFNAGQGVRGLLARYGADTGQLDYAQNRADQQRSQTAQGATQGVEGALGFGKLLSQGSGSGSGGSPDTKNNGPDGGPVDPWA